MASLENEIVNEIRMMKKNPKITKSWLMEWSSAPIKNPQEGEELLQTPSGFYCAIKQPEKKAKVKK